MCKQSVQPFGSTFPLFPPFGARPLPSFGPLFAPLISAPEPFTETQAQEESDAPFRAPPPPLPQRVQGNAGRRGKGTPPCPLFAPVYARTDANAGPHTTRHPSFAPVPVYARTGGRTGRGVRPPFAARPRVPPPAARGGG